MITKNEMQQLLQALPLSDLEYQNLQREIKSMPEDDPQLQEKFKFLQQWRELMEIDDKILEALERWDKLMEEDQEKLLKLIEQDRSGKTNKRIAELKSKLAEM